ncbi:MAG: hypothetical protein J0H15_03805 [Xanthomonadales bacterium]|nr:hypothetical protein [Xanthomonadales bacterium]
MARLPMSEPARHDFWSRPRAPGVNRSTNGGATWSVRVPGSEALAAKSVVVGADTTYVGASSPAVFRSDDAGASFAQSADGISELSLYSIAVDPRNPAHLAAAFQGNNNGGVFSSDDGGRSWTLEALSPTRYSKVGHAADGTLYAISSSPTSIAPEGLYRRDGKGAWTSLGPDQGPYFESDLDALLFSANDPGLILLGGDFGVAGWGSTVWRSTDAGQNWTKVFLGDDNDKVSDLEFASADDDAEVVAVYDGFNDPQQGGALRSDDSGASWSPALNGLPGYMRQPHLCRTTGVPAAVYLAATGNAGNGAVFRSDDAGGTWNGTAWSGPSIADIACDPLDGDVLYLAQFGADRVVRSEDAGASFAPYAQGLEGSGAPRELATTMGQGETQLVLATASGSYATLPDEEIFVDGFDG